VAGSSCSQPWNSGSGAVSSFDATSERNRLTRALISLVVDDGGVSLLCVPGVLGLVTSVIMSAGRSVSISSSSYVFPRVVTIIFFFFVVLFLRLVRGGVLSFKKAGGPKLRRQIVTTALLLEGGKQCIEHKLRSLRNEN
jgi:hypothetical protein